MYLSFANFSHMPTWDKGCHWTGEALLRKVSNSGMLKDTLRSSKVLGEAAKNVIHLLYLLRV